MTLEIWLWLIMGIWLLFGIYSSRPPGAGQPWNWEPLPSTLILWLLLAILGWHAFGSPIKG